MTHDVCNLLTNGSEKTNNINDTNVYVYGHLSTLHTDTDTQSRIINVGKMLKIGNQEEKIVAEKRESKFSICVVLKSEQFYVDMLSLTITKFSFQCMKYFFATSSTLRSCFLPLL